MLKIQARGGDTIVNKHIYRKFLCVALTLFLTAVFVFGINAATLSPTLQAQLPSLANSASVGVVIISFNTSSGLTASNLTTLHLAGITNGVTFQKLGMVGAVLNAGQVRSLANNSSVRSIWTNDRLRYFMNAARTVTGVDQLRIDSGFTFRNGGMPVSGNGDFSVLVIDTGIDATHADLPFGTKVIQNKIGRASCRERVYIKGVGG